MIVSKKYAFFSTLYVISDTEEMKNVITLFLIFETEQKFFD